MFIGIASWKRFLTSELQVKNLFSYPAASPAPSLSGALQSLSTLAQCSPILFYFLAALLCLVLHHWLGPYFCLASLNLLNLCDQSFSPMRLVTGLPICCFAGSEILNRRVRMMFASLGVCGFWKRRRVPACLCLLPNGLEAAALRSIPAWPDRCPLVVVSLQVHPFSPCALLEALTQRKEM